MNTYKELDTPIKEFFTISEEHLSSDIYFLMDIKIDTGNKDNKPIRVRTINALLRAGYNDIRDVLNATRRDLTQVRDLGSKCQQLLFELLQKFTESPVSPELIRQKKLDQIRKRLREMGMII
ncbi:DNA-directed RNA polymerase subunit alpha [compost metagenome]